MRTTRPKDIWMLAGAVLATILCIEVRAACAQVGDNALEHFKLELTLYQKRDLDGAIKEFREAIRLKPDYPDAHINLGNVLDEKGDHDAASPNTRWPSAFRRTFRGPTTLSGSCSRRRATWMVLSRNIAKPFAVALLNLRLPSSFQEKPELALAPKIYAPGRFEFREGRAFHEPSTGAVLQVYVSNDPLAGVAHDAVRTRFLEGFGQHGFEPLLWREFMNENPGGAAAWKRSGDKWEPVSDLKPPPGQGPIPERSWGIDTLAGVFLSRPVGGLENLGCLSGPLAGPQIPE